MILKMIIYKLLYICRKCYIRFDQVRKISPEIFMTALDTHAINNITTR